MRILRVKQLIFILGILAVFSLAQGQTLTRGHQTLLDHGLQIQALAFVLETGYFDTARWAESNFTSIDLWGHAAYSSPIMPSPPGIPWSRWILNGGTDIVSSEQPYVSNLIRLQISDEQNITDPTELAYVASTVASLQAKYPNVMIHTNQFGNQHSVSELSNYMQQVKPDMLMFDTYPFNGDVDGGSPTDYYRDIEKYRKLGLAGNDGTGTQPIPVGAYTQTYIRSGHTVSESEIRLNQFSAWAFGCKLVDSFVYDNPQHDSGVQPALFDGNGTANPTEQFYQIAETNRQSLNLGSALVRLISTDLRMKMGEHEETSWIFTSVEDNDRPSGVSSWDSSADPYITSISEVVNLGNRNDDLDGDVIVGYFKPLDASFTNEGHEDDIYFMVVNGLSDENGSAEECRQMIRLNFDFGDSGITQLLRMSRETGEVEEVALIHDGGSLYHLDLILDGGTGDLLKFDNGGVFVPEPTTMGILGLCSIVVFCRSKR